MTQHSSPLQNSYPLTEKHKALIKYFPSVSLLFISLDLSLTYYSYQIFKISLFSLFPFRNLPTSQPFYPLQMSHKRLKDLSSLDLPLTSLLNPSLNSNYSTKSHPKSKDPRMTHPKIKPYLKYSMDVPDNVLRILAPRYRAKQMRRLDAPNLLAYLTYRSEIINKLCLIRWLLVEGIRYI